MKTYTIWAVIAINMVAEIDRQDLSVTLNEIMEYAMDSDDGSSIPIFSEGEPKVIGRVYDYNPKFAWPLHYYKIAVHVVMS